MIDTHCHLLPGLDDGPRGLDEALELARQLVSVGVWRVICTPHYSRRYPTDHRTATTRLEEMRAALARAAIPLELGLAAEIAPSAAIESGAEALLTRQLGDRRVLVEVNRDTPAGFLELLLDRLGELELRLVLAHPERCPALHSQPHLIDHARSRGTLVQVVAPSLVGRWGETAAQAAWRLLESGRVDILASDAHRPSHSRFSLRQALPVLAQRLGATRLRMLTEDCPAAALSV